MREGKKKKKKNPNFFLQKKLSSCCLTNPLSSFSFFFSILSLDLPVFVPEKKTSRGPARRD